MILQPRSAAIFRPARARAALQISTRSVRFWAFLGTFSYPERPFSALFQPQRTLFQLTQPHPRPELHDLLLFGHEYLLPDRGE